MERLQEWIAAHPALEVREEDGQGRFLVAARDVAAGELLLVQYPYAWCTFEAYADKTCRCCMGPLPGALLEAGAALPPVLQQRMRRRRLQCKVCLSVAYCSAQCQRQDAKEHFQDECRVLKQLQAAPPGALRDETLSELKLLLRAVSRMKAERIYGLPQETAPGHAASPEAGDEAESDGSDAGGGEGSDGEGERRGGEGEEGEGEELRSWVRNRRFEDYLLLVARPEDFPKEEVASLRYWIVDYLRSLQAYFRQCMEGGLARAVDAKRRAAQETSLEVTDGDLLLEMLCRNRRNGFCFGNGVHEEPQGHGVYLAPALFNHSCAPNVRLVTLGPEQEAAADLPLPDGGSSKRTNAAGPLLLFEAAQAVAKGQPLTLSYLDNGLLVDDSAAPRLSARRDCALRRKELMESFRFHCACARCLEDEVAREVEEEEEVQEEEVEAAAAQPESGALCSAGAVVQTGDDDDLAVAGREAREAGAGSEAAGAAAREESDEEEGTGEEESGGDSAGEWEDHSRPGGDEEAWRWLEHERQLLGSVQHLDLGAKGRVAFRVEGFSIKLDNAFKATRYVVIRALQAKGGPRPQQREMEWETLQPLLAKAQRCSPSNELE